MLKKHNCGARGHGPGAGAGRGRPGGARPGPAGPARLGWARPPPRPLAPWKLILILILILILKSILVFYFIFYFYFFYFALSLHAFVTFVQPSGSRHDVVRQARRAVDHALYAAADGGVVCPCQPRIGDHGAVATRQTESDALMRIAGPLGYSHCWSFPSKSSNCQSRTC